MSSSDSRFTTATGPCLFLARLSLFSSGVSLTLSALLIAFAFAAIYAAASSEFIEFPSSPSSSDTT
eukprot:9434006-Heterocapsa_arctica.AAC.1